jgi:hypothetical protein
MRAGGVAEASQPPLLVEKRPRDDAGVVEVAADLVAQGLLEQRAGAFRRREKARDVPPELTCRACLPNRVLRGSSALMWMRIILNPARFASSMSRLEELVVGGGVEPVGVVGLIQHAAQVDGLAVEQHDS